MNFEQMKSAEPHFGLFLGQGIGLATHKALALLSMAL